MVIEALDEHPAHINGVQKAKTALLLIDIINDLNFDGAAALLIGARGVVGQLQMSLNKIWGVEPKSGLGVWGFVGQRFISYAMVLAVGFLLLVSLVVSALVSGLSQFVGTLIGGPQLLRIY
jgi:uncharacterized BrkB/YihY/UPF0761 family membrane protein